jgi:hypothetical protein
MSVIYHRQKPLESRGTTMHFGWGRRGAKRQLAYLFVSCTWLVSCLTYTSTLMIRSSETSMDFNRTTRRDKTLLLMFQPFSTVLIDRPREFETEERLKENLYVLLYEHIIYTIYICNPQSQLFLFVRYLTTCFFR